MRKLIITLLLFVTSTVVVHAQELDKTDLGFEPQEITMIQSGNKNMPMRVFKITNEQDSILLRQQSKKVQFKKKDQELLQLLVDRMLATVTDSMSLGAGIAAPQVGISRNLALVQRFDKERYPFEVIINPIIKQYTDKK
jgi:peptide deformylase